jgi:hypothetical protein
VSAAFALIALSFGCTKPPDRAAPLNEAYGYENVDDPGAAAEAST